MSVMSGESDNNTAEARAREIEMENSCVARVTQIELHFHATR